MKRLRIFQVVIPATCILLSACSQNGTLPSDTSSCSVEIAVARQARDGNHFDVSLAKATSAVNCLADKNLKDEAIRNDIFQLQTLLLALDNDFRQQKLWSKEEESAKLALQVSEMAYGKDIIRSRDAQKDLVESLDQQGKKEELKSALQTLVDSYIKEGQGSGFDAQRYQERLTLLQKK